MLERSCEYATHDEPGPDRGKKEAVAEVARVEAVLGEEDLADVHDARSELGNRPDDEHRQQRP